MKDAYERFDARWLFRHIELIWCDCDVTNTSNNPEDRLPKVNIPLGDVLWLSNEAEHSHSGNKEKIFRRVCKVKYHNREYTIKVFVNVFDADTHFVICRMYTVDTDLSQKLLAEYAEYF